MASPIFTSDAKSPSSDGAILVPMIVAPLTRNPCGDNESRESLLIPVAFTCKDYGGDAGEISPTLRAMEFGDTHANGGGQVAVCFAQNTRDEVRLIGGDGQITGALAAEAGMKQQNYVAFTQNQAGDVLSGNVFPSMGTNQNATGRNTPKVMDGMAVRRLTPVECERLQGFPDNFTLIPYRKKFAADGPRYRALGNSMAVPVLLWLGKRIQKLEASRA